MTRKNYPSLAFLATVAIFFSDGNFKTQGLSCCHERRHRKMQLFSTSKGYPTSGSSAIQSTTSTTDRRNQSLEQGHHPLWSLNLNLDSMAQAGAGNRAQELLKRIHALYREGYYEVSPDIVSYNSVLKAWKQEEQPEAALDLLETMIRNEQASDATDKTIRVDVISFNTVLAAFANQGNYERALELLRKMQGQSDDDYFYPHPDTITYNIVLYSLAQSKDLGTAAKAENLLREMMMRKEKTGLSVVDTRSFNTVLYAWSREGDKKEEGSRKKPVSTKNAAQRAEDLLTIMEELSEAGNLNVRPDVYSYTTVIQSWAKANQFSNRAQAILDKMVAKGLQPNQVTYTALMNALSKGGKPEKAEGVLKQMMRDTQHKPDVVALSSVIDGWAKVSSRDRPEAAKRALQVLETMKQRSIEPTATTYTSVLNALAKSGTRDACLQALDLLQEMEEGHMATKGDDESKGSPIPTNIHYNCVLNAYARSSRADKAIKAQQLMTVMENHVRPGCLPDTISYNSLLMACAHATGNEEMREESFGIALRTFKKLVSSEDNDLVPTSATFAHFFRATRKLLRPQNPRRKSILTKSLVVCRKLGLLNFLIVHQVQLACPTDDDWKEIAGELSEHLGREDDFKTHGKSVPQTWTSNARR